MTQTKQGHEREQGYLVVARGQGSLKIVDGKVELTTPFAGVIKPPKLSRFGVGLIFPYRDDNAVIWVPERPNSLMESWRAMKMIEQVNAIETGALRGVWSAVDKDHQSEYDYRRRIAGLVAELGEERFEALRTQILDQVPSRVELDSMLTILKDNKVEIDSWALTREVEAGRLTTSPLIDELVRKDEEKRKAYELWEKELEQPLPPGHRLADLFQQLGIENMINGSGLGGGGIDCGFVTLEELEQTLRILSRYSDDPDRGKSYKGETLYHATGEGKVINPSVRVKDGTQYTFTHARFENGEFIISTQVKPKKGEALEGAYTVPELTEMLATLLEAPQSTSLRQRIMRAFGRGN